MAIRGVTISPNDGIFATHSFDSLKVWSVDLFSANQKGEFTIQCKQSLNEANILSATILPGNKYIVLGTKSGQIALYDANTNLVMQRLQAHSREVWEVSYHTNPEGLKGSLLVASASADKSIKFHTLAQKGNGDVQLQFYEKIETTDEVMGVKFSPDGRFFVFSLLD
jgi:U3 small nucleolar RNA-associated protein 12